MLAIFFLRSLRGSAGREKVWKKEVGDNPRHEWGVYWLKNPLPLIYSKNEDNHIRVCSRSTRAKIWATDTLLASRGNVLWIWLSRSPPPPIGVDNHFWIHMSTWARHWGTTISLFSSNKTLCSGYWQRSPIPATRNELKLSKSVLVISFPSLGIGQGVGTWQPGQRDRE